MTLVPLGGGVLRLVWLVGWLVGERRAGGRATTPRRGCVLAEGSTTPVSRRRTAVSADHVVTNRFGMQFICLLLLAQTEN